MVNMAIIKRKPLQIRPKDRPVVLYCRVCRLEMSDKGWHYKDNRPADPPADISEIPCGRCGTKGSLVFNEVVDIDKPAWEPHCGNEKCDGTCTDLLCIPPVTDKTDNIVKITEKPYDWLKFLGLGTTLGIIVGYLIWSH